MHNFVLICKILLFHLVFSSFVFIDTCFSVDKVKYFEAHLFLLSEVRRVIGVFSSQLCGGLHGRSSVSC